MGLFDRWTKKTDPEVKKEVKPEVKKETTNKKKTAKDIATEKGEPYVAVIDTKINENNVRNGFFELDWNEIFVARLVKAGYMMKKEDTDAEIVDRWWTQVCRNVALELYEQQQADPENRYRTDMRVVRTKDIGDGRTEVS